MGIEWPEGQREVEREGFVAILRDFVAMAGEGFRLELEEGTGGGCTADVIYAPDERELLITDDATAPYSRGEFTGLVFGYFGGEFREEDGYATLEPGDDTTENIESLLAAWLQGDPFRDIEGNEVQ